MYQINKFIGKYIPLTAFFCLFFIPLIAAQPVQKGERSSSFAVQLCSRKDIKEVKDLQKKLEEKGFPSYSVEKTVNDVTWYRLRIGFFDSKRNAEEKALEVLGKIRAIKEYLIIIPSKEEVERQQ